MSMKKQKVSYSVCCGYEIIETSLPSGKPQTAVTSLQLFHTLARRSVQFSSVHFYLAKIQYNTRIHIGIVRLQGSPEETRRLYETWAPQCKRNKQN